MDLYGTYFTDGRWCRNECREIRTLRENVEYERGSVGVRELTMNDLYLAWQMGKLNQDDEYLYAIPTMTEEEVKEKIHNNGELVDWE